MIKGILKTVGVILYVVGYFIFSLGLWVKIKILESKGESKKAREITNQAADRWGKKMVSATGSNVEVKGGENIPDEPVLVISNHQSAVDIPLLVGHLDCPLAFVAKWELKKIPILSTWMKQIKCIFIKRSNLRQTLQAFKDAGEVFNAGQSLVVFPEGTRSRSAKLGKFRRGSFKIAFREDVPILPVTIKDSYKAWEGNNNLIQAADIDIIISEPIYPAELTEEEKKNIKSTVRDIIKENLYN